MKDAQSIFHGTISEEALRQDLEEYKEILKERKENAEMHWAWLMFQKMHELGIPG